MSAFSDVAARLAQDLSDGDRSSTDGWGAAWQRLSELGFRDMAVDPGGDGGSLRDAFDLLEALAARGLTTALPDVLLARWATAHTGWELGPRPAMVPPQAVVVELSARGDAVSGRAHNVPWASGASELVMALDAPEPVLVSIPRDGAGVLVRPGFDAAGRERSTVELAGVRLARPPAPARATGAAILQIGSATRCALIAGALRTAVRLSVEYARDRNQFGRPLARFQAVAHRLALLKEQSATAAVVSDMVAQAIGPPTEYRGGAEMTVASGRVVANAAAFVGARHAHQVHGAIGVTVEHPLRHVTLPVMAWATEYGTDDHWRSRAEAGLRAQSENESGLVGLFA